MPSIDMPLEQMRQYKPTLYREADFEAYWETTAREAVNQPLNAELIPYVLPMQNLQCYAVRFDGYKGGRIAGWYVRPTATGKFPGLCMYHGYSGRAPRPLDMIPYAAQGICVLSMDCRGQNGQSQDASIANEGFATGWMTKGIRDPKQYYFRYVYADAVRALELLARREEVDDRRLAVTGVSQGGALTLAVAALSDRPIPQTGPYQEITVFLKSFPHLYENAIRTLSYCDNLNLAPRIRCRTIVSNGLWDDICPPSTIYAVYNHITSEKQMEIYPFHKHEVPYDHNELKFRTLMDVLRP
jgi:cephalosporin-C deacetylase